MHDRKSDWKKFTKLKERALQHFCEGVLKESRAVCDDPTKTAHERYLQLYRLTRQRDKELSRAFDGHSRSKADQQLAIMCLMGLVADGELSEFSERTRAIVELFTGQSRTS